MKYNAMNPMSGSLSNSTLFNPVLLTNSFNVHLISIVTFIFIHDSLIDIRTSEFLSHGKESLDTFIMIIYPDEDGDMPELMTREPGIESTWTPFLGPTVRVNDDPGDVS